MARYYQTALAFPVQTLTFQPMNGNLKLRPIVDLSLTTTPRFVDSIFILFPYNNLYRSVYHNPNLTNWALKMGGYGQVPDIPTDTWGTVFYELCSNALNTNNDSQGFNHEVERSIAYPGQKDWLTKSYRSFDDTNFFIGIPVETDYTFQQGQTSNSAITYQFKANQTGDPNPDNPPLKYQTPFFRGMTSNPLMGCLKVSVLAIQLREGGTPIISLDEYDISSPS
jgi:hypothetical protein